MAFKTICISLEEFFFHFFISCNISQVCFLTLFPPPLKFPLQLGYDKSKVKSISLRGCSNINFTAVEDILKLFPSIEAIDIRESGHLGELSASYKEVNWIGGRRTVDTNPEDSYTKIRSLKQVTERSYINSRANWEYGSHVYDPANKINPLSDRKILAANSIQQTPYNRRKLFGARKASAVLSRDAHLRRWLNQKSENRYKKMEEYLASYLKDIMKKNTCDFFVPKVLSFVEKHCTIVYFSLFTLDDVFPLPVGSFFFIIHIL